MGDNILCVHARNVVTHLMLKKDGFNVQTGFVNIGFCSNH